MCNLVVVLLAIIACRPSSERLAYIHTFRGLHDNLQCQVYDVYFNKDTLHNLTLEAKKFVLNGSLKNKVSHESSIRP